MGITMTSRKDRPEPEPAQPQSGPSWQKFLDQEERPSREDLAKGHSPFESLLEPVPIPRWLRGRRRAPRDKLS
jgi:hypothetical protein